MGNPKPVVTQEFHELTVSKKSKEIARLRAEASEVARAAKEVVAERDAEIAKLRAERDEAKVTLDHALDARDRWRDLATKRTSDITALTIALAAARAALDGERERKEANETH